MISAIVSKLACPCAIIGRKNLERQLMKSAPDFWRCRHSLFRVRTDNLPSCGTPWANVTATDLWWEVWTRVRREVRCFGDEADQALLSSTSHKKKVPATDMEILLPWQSSFPLSLRGPCFSCLPKLVGKMCFISAMGHRRWMTGRKPAPAATSICRVHFHSSNYRS